MVGDNLVDGKGDHLGYDLDEDNDVDVDDGDGDGDGDNGGHRRVKKVEMNQDGARGLSCT